MGRLADQITEALAGEVESRTGWDEAPGLYFLYMEGGQCRLSELDVPNALWVQDRPPLILAAMADGLGDFAGYLQRVAPEGLHGVAFRHESWMVAEGKPGSPETASIRADAKAHRLHLRPDRIEARNMWAVDRAGVTYAAVQRRGEGEAQRTVTYPKPGEGFTGIIPEALDRLVTTLLGVTRGRP